MVEIRFNGLSQDDCKKLAILNMETRKGTPVESNMRLEEVTKSIKNLSISDGYRTVTAHKDGRIVGWLYYYIQFPLMTFINGFYPVVESGSEDVARAMIEASKKETVERGHNRLEIELVFPSDVHREYSKSLVDLYIKCGFQFAAEEIHMRCNLNESIIPERNPPEGYTLRMFLDTPYETLEQVGYRTLKDSKEGLFLSMTHDEQMVTLQYFFDKEKSYIDDASLILESNGEIMGFVITRIGDDDEPEIGPIGLVPEARGKGLGSFLLVRALKSLKDSGYTSVSLDTTVTNHPAQRLYRKYGFEDVYYKQFYFWSP
ncbi:MAG: GNAT family N-acetyltransferase [Candidatus Thorarchaeota archaeon]